MQESIWIQDDFLAHQALVNHPQIYHEWYGLYNPSKYGWFIIALYTVYMRFDGIA
jgi:hypothetical protein